MELGPEAGEADPLVGADQGASDADQAAADVDQVASDSDQAAADKDQVASDRDLADGGDPRLHDESRDEREESAKRRSASNTLRSESASDRDSVARLRDLAAAARDRAAAALDRESEERADGNGEHQVDAHATQARLKAAEDRRQAASDRQSAADDRLQARLDHAALLEQLVASELDALTGTRSRGPGLADLDNEVERARRTSGLLAVAYVDVVGLKAVNDLRGHSAGDALLQGAVRTIRSHIRSYDEIVRVGGDEFLCVLSGAKIECARRRFDSVQAALASDPSQGEIKVGVAALRPDESAAQLIDRADADMSTARVRTE